jgi:hypothetical protein
MSGAKVVRDFIDRSGRLNNAQQRDYELLNRKKRLPGRHERELLGAGAGRLVTLDYDFDSQSIRPTWHTSGEAGRSTHRAACSE